MPPPYSPALAVSCYYGNAREVEALLRAGADPLARVVSATSLRLKEKGLSLHQACHFAHVGCVRALVARDDDWPQLDHRRESDGA